jgi:hypothetical protein
LAEQGHAKAIARLQGPEMSPMAEVAWMRYVDIAQGKTGGGMGPAPLSWQDVRAYQEVTGEVLLGVEVVWAMTADAGVRAALTDKE